MKQEQLYAHLDRVAARLTRVRVLQRSAIACALAGLVVLAMWSSSTRIELAWLSQNVATAIASMTLLSLLGLVFFNRLKVNRQAAARAIEKQFPDLNQRLLAALEQQPSLATGRLTYLQDQVVGEALQHARQHDWSQTIPTTRLASSACYQCLGFVLFATAVSAIWLRPPLIAAVEKTTGAGSKEASTVQIEYGITVEPGDTEVERGTDLLVLARFDRRVPSDVVVIADDPHGQSQRQPLSKSLDDPIFGGQLAKVEQDITYVVEYDGNQTKPFRVTVFEFPQLERLDAVIQFPEYTGLPETTLEETRRISVVEGSQITLIGQANKPIASAKLVDENDAAIEFDVSSENNSFELTLRPKENRSYELLLRDEQGRQNKFPQQIIIEVTPNRRPEIKLTFPAKDLRVSPLEELTLEAATWDDFGLTQYGLIYGMAGQQPITHVIGESVPGLEHRDIAHLLPLEQIQAKPDQLLSYYFFADDYGPDGKLRRTCSDMYFAEVRHFEEIFRQGQQPPGGASKQQGGGSPQSKKLEELAKLQKQIINATWKIIRNESSELPSRESFGADVQLIADSQQAALDQLRKLEQKLKNPKSKGLVAAVVEQMTTARDTLKQAVAEENSDPLTTALSSEQAAYQGLLKLRAREHKVSQNKSGGGGGGGGSSRSQQQMNQLELSNKENRYQTKQQASANKSSPANREQLQVLNRLRDLARRQQGVNDKLKELDNALRQAKTEQEKEELRRRLKRLRDEQQEMLRDVDKLRNRMERPENQLKMAKDRQQLNKTREKIRQTSEALKEGQVSKALNSGTRTERDLKNLKDDFRKRTAGQFADEMKNLRDQTRKLAEKQGELSQQLKSLDRGRRTLRDSDRRQKIARDMTDQKRNLDAVLNQAKDVVRKAEQTEPLLSRKLYDTVRKARDDQPGEHLRKAAELADKGLAKQAGESQQQANRGIERLREGIEQAAESVLGSEAEALRTAKRELDDITKALKNEVAQADPHQRNGAGSKPKQTASATPSGKPEQSSRQQRKEAKNGRSPGAQSGKQSSQQNGSPNQAKSGKSSAGGKSSSGKSSSGKSSSGQSSAGQGSSPGKSPGGQKSGLRGNSQNKSSPGQPSPLSSFMNQGGMAGGPGNHGGQMKPLTGDDFRKWSDKLRDVEEMVEDPKLRDEVARVRGRARSMRVEFKRHSKEPNWDVVRDTILEPLVELQQRLAQEIASRESQDSLVPIDREPVPDRFSDLVEKYYERLGKGREEMSEDRK